MPKSTSLTTLAEADLAALAKRGTALERRRDEAAIALTAATAERRRLLVDSDEPVAKDLAAADRAVRDATDARDAAVDALAEVESRAADLRDRINRLKVVAERESQAVILETVASKVDDAAARIAKAVKEIAVARADIAAALTPETVGLYAPPDHQHFGTPTALVTRHYDIRDGRRIDMPIAPQTVASRFVGHLVAPVMPSLGIADEREAHAFHMARTVTPTLVGVETPESVSALLATPLRARATALRDGEVISDDLIYVPPPASDTARLRPPEAPQGFTGKEIAPGVMRLTPIAPEPAKAAKGGGHLSKVYPEGTTIYPPGAAIPDDGAAA